MSDSLSLPNVARHILNNPAIPSDPVYQQQIKLAIRSDEAAWDLERAGRAFEQQSFAEFLAVVASIAATLEHHGDSEIRQCFDRLESAAMDMAGVGVTQLQAKLPVWNKARLELLKQWREAYESPIDRMVRNP